jgi:hypothetical protein
LNNEQLHIEEIDAYLQGKLNPEETAAFEQKLKSDSSFAEAFKNQKLLSELIKENARLELKAFLNTHAKTKLISSNNWLQSKIFAIAATAVILIGAFIVFQFYSSPKLEQNIALEETAPITETETQEPVVVSPESDQNKQSESYNDKDLLNEIVPPTIEEQKAIEMESMDDAPPILDQISEDRYYQAESDYNVAQEINIKDTFLFATSLTMLDLNGRKDSYGNNRKLESKSAQLPAAASNSNQAKALEDKKKSIDTSGLSKSKIANKQNIKTKFMVEFWSSPINFKGYKYGNNIIQLFGLNNYNCKLYTVNGSLYLRHLEKVYIILPCIDGCPYKLEVDPDIVQFILNQN